MRKNEVEGSIEIQGEENIEDNVAATLATLNTRSKPKESNPREPFISFIRENINRIWFIGKPNPPYSTAIIIEETPSPKKEELEERRSKKIISTIS